MKFRKRKAAGVNQLEFAENRVKQINKDTASLNGIAKSSIERMDQLNEEKKVLINYIESCKIASKYMPEKVNLEEEIAKD